MVDGAPSSESSAEPTKHEDLPDRLRVHSLARTLGTTSRRVLDALAALDGRVRSAHSSVDQVDAVRVRDLLAAQPDAQPEAQPAESEPVEPESRLLLETPETPEPAAERPHYMPLFVAPQPLSERAGTAVAAPAEEIAEDTEEDGSEDDGSGADDDDPADRPANKRRRRGRRGRGRGRGEQGGPDGPGDQDQSGQDGFGDDTDADQDQDSDDGDDGDGSENGDDDNGTGEGGSRRRRRRRRRKSGGGEDGDDNPSPDDPPNTVVHERAPRGGKSGSDNGDSSGSGEIKGIDGSTRLEAKRQRRRDGRDAGRRRPPVLSEAEFLARREAVERVMVVRDRVRTEPPHPGARYTQIAVLEDGIVVEHFVTSAASASLVGNIYLGIVQNVLPSMEAAFVDIGRGRNGVLYAGEVNWEAAGLGGADRKIEQALKPGDYVVVQVSKDPVGHKGARLTTQVSLAGRYLVYVPGASSTGISRKLPDTERQRLKEILREVVPSNAGVIIRTASEGVKEEDIRGDVTRLQERWNQIDAKAAETKQKAAGAAVALYEEPDVLVKVIRDLFNEDFSGLIVSGDEAWTTINEYVNSVAPDLVSKLTKYEPASETGPDVFAVHRIDEQLTKAMDRKVWLPSGGTLVIDRTEAMTVIDVNTGKFTGSGGNLEQTVTKNNIEAAEEIVRQLRLRDIGGIIVIDFIDMVLESNRDLVLRRLTEALARDRTRHQVSEVTSLGLVQLTRKRLGTGLIEAFSTSCPQCAGRGILLHTDPVDSAPATGRKSESASRRNRRSKKNRSEENDEKAVVAKVPVHAPGEHPMFKAMAASSRDDDEADESGTDSPGADDEELAADLVAADNADEADFEDADEDTDDSDDDEDSDDEDDLDDEDLVDDDDLDDDDDDDDDGDDDDDDDDDGDDSDEIDDEDDEDDEDVAEIDDVEDSDSDESDELDGDDDVSDDSRASVVVVEQVSVIGPRRRRAAGRPAGPPIHAD
ncbi:Rne/Rng family ribonuclease [Mycobacterium vicinigordonae]|uniref:Ribonuclease E n=1 Tax=Mycobacterium vicinigordonae TaxID=1719132 RepID=A0A7D6DWP9_9MYCO|nr:Rne/Rng family ribonuclease [Mycobacterium vicinigordonae]QLL05889.1 ribonuclease E/G [Mycobacterium vicinigordonae]